MKNLYFHPLILVLIVLLLISCENDDCDNQCSRITGHVVVNSECECDCLLERDVLVSGPVFHLCNFIHPNHTYSLRLEEYSRLNCEEIDLAFLNVLPEFDGFRGFLRIPYTSEDIKEEALTFGINIAKNGEFNAVLNNTKCFAVTQNGGDRSELLLYHAAGISQIYSPEEARPFYLKGCEDTRKPARAKAYISEDLISLHFFFYLDEDTYYNHPDQYLYSEILNFERQFSKYELED